MDASEKPPRDTQNLLVISESVFLQVQAFPLLDVIAT